MGLYMPVFDIGSPAQLPLNMLHVPPPVRRLIGSDCYTGGVSVLFRRSLAADGGDENDWEICDCIHSFC